MWFLCFVDVDDIFSKKSNSKFKKQNESSKPLSTSSISNKPFTPVNHQPPKIFNTTIELNTDISVIQDKIVRIFVIFDF